MPKVGYVALVGRPNAGKSTLINAIIGEKVSAVSHRPQTTQRAIRGIFTNDQEDVQIIFLDTPGIHEVQNELQGGSQKNFLMNHIINKEAFSGLRKADIIVRLLDPTRPYGREDERIDSILSHVDTPIVRIETKQDMTNKSYPQKGVDIHIDSIHGTGFEELIGRITELLPTGPLLYDPDYYTDQSTEQRISEVIREALFHELGEEIPYASYVAIEMIEHETKRDGSDLMKISASIFVESESQKTIMIGTGGKKIQAIGSRSRVELEHIFGRSIFLGLRVKVHKNWRKNEKLVQKILGD